MPYQFVQLDSGVLEANFYFISVVAKENVCVSCFPYQLSGFLPMGLVPRLLQDQVPVSLRNRYH